MKAIVMRARRPSDRGLRVANTLVDRANHATVGVFELPDDEHDEVVQGPKAESAEGDELQETGADLTGVEAMDTKATEKEAQQNRGDKATGTSGSERVWSRHDLERCWLGGLGE